MTTQSRARTRSISKKSFATPASYSRPTCFLVLITSRNLGQPARVMFLDILPKISQFCRQSTSAAKTPLTRLLALPLTKVLTSVSELQSQPQLLTQIMQFRRAPQVYGTIKRCPPAWLPLLFTIQTLAREYRALRLTVTLTRGSGCQETGAGHLRAITVECWDLRETAI